MVRFDVLDYGHQGEEQYECDGSVIGGRYEDLEKQILPLRALVSRLTSCECFADGEVGRKFSCEILYWW